MQSSFVITYNSRVICVFQSVDESLLDESFNSQLITGYQTMTDAKDLSAIKSRLSKNNQPTTTQKLPEEMPYIRPVYTPHFQMSKTRNKYRLKKRAPSACDEMLFGNSQGALPDKEWKAPWDKTRTVQPLVFDSMDRTGFYSVDPPKTVMPHHMRNQKKPWK